GRRRGNALLLAATRHPGGGRPRPRNPVRAAGFRGGRAEQREEQCEQRIRPIRVLLENQGDLLLAFAEQLDEDRAALAQQWEGGAATVREVMQTQQMSERDSRRWRREAMHWRQLGARYYGLSAAVQELAAGVVRASSLVENVNSRLR